MGLDDLYNDIILEYASGSEHKHTMENPTVEEEGHNPSCGDEIRLQLRLKGDMIEEASFDGDGCAISQASTAMMCELIQGKSLEEARELSGTFISMIKREITDEKELEKLEDAIALRNISNMPARVKCAVFAWYTLNHILDERSKSEV